MEIHNRLNWIAIVTLVLITSYCREPEPEKTFYQILKDLPGVSVTVLPSNNGFNEVYRLMVEQPVDHNNPGGQTFRQEVIVKKGLVELPVVYDTKGYGLTATSRSTLNNLFPSNYVGVEHRYFADSRPYPLNWEFLTIEQSATDHHKIYEILKDIFPGKWVNTGASKGGMTAIFHKRFYPDDMDATVAFVAPIITDLPDERFDKFLSEEVGDESCRAKIEEFQKIVLSRRNDMLALLENTNASWNYTFSMGYEKVLELLALEYQFSFWQYGGSDCSSIPSKSASDEDIFSHLTLVSPPWYYDDFYLDYFHPFFYQAYTELGYYYFIDDHLQGLITELDGPNHFELAPDVNMTYDPTVMQDILNWLETDGDNIIYIYGADDPYTSTAVPDPIGTNSVRIIQPGTDHRVNIDDLDDKETVYSLLEDWLDVKIK